MGCREVMSKKQFYLSWKISEVPRNSYLALEGKISQYSNVFENPTRHGLTMPHCQGIHLSAESPGSNSRRDLNLGLPRAAGRFTSSRSHTGFFLD